MDAGPSSSGAISDAGPYKPDARNGTIWNLSVLPSRQTKRAMRHRTPQIVALGGGGFSMEKDGSLLDEYVLSLAPAARPRVCFLPTASGDADHYVVRFYRRFSSDCEASHVLL